MKIVDELLGFMESHYWPLIIYFQSLYNFCHCVCSDWHKLYSAKTFELPPLVLLSILQSVIAGVFDMVMGVYQLETVKIITAALIF
ncbi:MAG: hypothetical protein WA749_16585 [Gelidibacter sp.]